MAQTEKDSLSLQSKDSLIINDSDTVLKIAEVMPEFPGGEKEWLKYLSSIRYPMKAKEKDMQGKVLVKFIIDKTGKVRDVTIAKSSGYEILDDASVTHISNSPDWKPGYQSGKPVNVEFIVPIKFILVGVEYGIKRNKKKKS